MKNSELIETILPSWRVCHGIEELRDTLAHARVSINKWYSFLDDFVDEQDIIARVKKQLLR